MIYSRFTIYSDVYIFHNGGGWLECCGCKFETVFLDEPKIDIFGIEWDVETDNFKASTAQAMLDHIKKHKRAGDKVPTRVMKRIKEDFPDLTMNLEDYKKYKEYKERKK
jgi:hypothetical protein